MMKFYRINLLYLSGTNQTYNVTIQSNQMGYVGSVRALVTYSLSESEDAQKETLESSFLGVLPFLTPAQYEEATATYRVFFINI